MRQDTKTNLCTFKMCQLQVGKFAATAVFTIWLHKSAADKLPQTHTGLLFAAHDGWTWMKRGGRSCCFSLSDHTSRRERCSVQLNQALLCSWTAHLGRKKKGLKHDDWSAAFLTLYQVTALQEGPLGSHSEHFHWIKSVKPFSLYDFPLIYYIWWMQHFITSMWWSCVDVALGHRLWQPDGLLFWLTMNQLPNVCV